MTTGRLTPARVAPGPLSEKHKQINTVIDVARINAFASVCHGLPGRPLKDCRVMVARVCS